MSANKVANDLKIGTSSVYRCLYRNKIVTVGLEQYKKNVEIFPPEIKQEIKIGYESGLTILDLKNKFGGSLDSISRAIKVAGGTIRPPQGQRTKTTYEDEIEMCKMYQNGVSLAGIEAIYKCCYSVVNRALQKHGIKKRRQRKLKNSGYSITDQGYLLKLVRENDAFSCMRNKRGYVLEHRLVMAKKLNRPLTKSETVHHIDGNKSNNHPDNLELRQGKHGKGVIMCCLDCGSKNIGHSNLS